MELWDIYKQGQFEEVINQGKALLNTGTESGSILLAVGRSLVDLQRHGEALFFLQRTVAADPQRTWIYAWGQVYLGKCRYHLQEMALAKEAWISARDCGATANATNEAVYYLKMLGLAEKYDNWNHFETEHFSFYFSPDLTGVDVKLYAQQHDEMFDYVTAWFKVSIERKSRFFVWGNKEEAHLAGMPELGFTMPEKYISHVGLSQTTGHELTHLVSHHAINPLVKTGLINEGIAVFLDGTGRNWLELAKEARMAQAKSRGTAEAVPLSVMSLWLDWDSQTVDVSYPVAGAFVNMLIEKGGRDRFLEAFKDQNSKNFHKVYGSDLTVWINDFDASLNN